MKKINNYILEKFKITKDIKEIDSHEKISFDDWIEYLSSIGLEYTNEIESQFNIRAQVKIKNANAPLFNLNIDKNYDFFKLSSIYLGEYDGKFDKKAKLTNNWWKKEYDINKDNGNEYFFTMNNADILKEKLQNIIDISK